MTEIAVKDHFFRDDLKILVAKSTEHFNWCYWRPVTDDPYHNRTFVSLLWTETSETNLYHTLWTLIKNENADLQECDCYRVIANGTIKGQEIGWHTDNGYKTVLYFPNEWQPEWGGSTFFKADQGKLEVHYRQNRLVIFPADRLHRGAGPNVENVLRVSIAFNLRHNKDKTRPVRAQV